MRPRSQGSAPEETRVCPFCAETIKRAAIVCRYCGRELPVESQTATTNLSGISPAIPLPSSTGKPVYTPPKRSGCVVVGGYLFIGFLVISVIIGIVSFASVSNSINTTTPSIRPTAQPTLTFAQIQQRALRITYDTLARDTETYVGQTVYIHGDVIQVMESSWNDSTDLRVYMDDGDTVYVHYEGARVLEGDTVDVYAKVDGRLTYETVLGASVTVPEVTALVLTVVNE